MTYSRRDRRSSRLKGYDYSTPGAYFVTICTHERALLFGEVVDAEMQLNGAGRMVARWWADLGNKFPHVTPEPYIVMPNHFHGIVIIQELDTRARAEARLCEALGSCDPIRFIPAACAHHDLRMREWVPTADGVRCRKTPASNAEHKLFLLQADPAPSKRWPLVPPHWRKNWFRGEPEEPVLGVLPWQAERLVESLQGNDDRIVTALPHGTNELSANFAGFTIWSSKWDLLFLTKPQTPNLVIAMPQHLMLWFALARTLDPDLVLL